MEYHRYEIIERILNENVENRGHQTGLNEIDQNDFKL